MHHRVAPHPAPRPTAPVIQPDLRLTGQVEMVNPSARFVVLSFPAGSMPVIDQRLNVFRQGLKVGEVKVTGPERGSNTVADILAGDPQAHDEVREP